MNPWCPNCTKSKSKGMNSEATLLVTRSSSRIIDTEKYKLLKKLGLSIKSAIIRGGRNKYWYCKRCKRRWLKGREVVQKK